MQLTQTAVPFGARAVAGKVQHPCTKKLETYGNIVQVAQSFGSTDLIWSHVPMMSYVLSMSFIYGRLLLLLVLAFSGRAGTSGSCSVCFRTSACSAWLSMTNSKYRNYMEHHGTTEALHQNANLWDLRSSDKNTEYSDTFVHWPFVHVFAKSKLWNKRDLLPE